jgi:hypothetical protein
MKRRHSQKTGTPLLAFLATCLLIGSVTPGFAKTYRWVDEEGNTVYSQSPPPSGDYKEVKIRKETPQSQQIEAAAKLKREQKQRSEARKQGEESAAQRERQESRKAARNQSCENARHNLEILKNPRLGRLMNEEGNYEILEDERRETLIREAQAQVREFCSEESDE